MSKDPQVPRLLAAVPVLHVASVRAAEAFYCGRLGFMKLWQYPDREGERQVYFAVQRDAVRLNLSSFPEDGARGTVVRLDVTDVDSLQAEFLLKQVAIELPPVDQSWGNREMYLRDPDGNQLRFVQSH